MKNIVRLTANKIKALLRENLSKNITDIEGLTPWKLMVAELELKGLYVKGCDVFIRGTEQKVAEVYNPAYDGKQLTYELKPMKALDHISIEIKI